MVTAILVPMKLKDELLILLGVLHDYFQNFSSLAHIYQTYIIHIYSSFIHITKICSYSSCNVIDMEVCGLGFLLLT